MALQSSAGRFELTGENLMTNGVSVGWVRAHRLHPFTVTVSGPGAPFAAVNVYVSNAATPPTDADANHTVLGSKTAPGAVLSDGPYNFVKVSGGAAGISANMTAANNAPAR